MKLGFLTAPFPETPLLEVADWAAGAGFEVLEIACWPRADGPVRRYAGTSHIDVANLSAGQATGPPRRDRGEGPRDLRPGLLPQPAPPRPGAPGHGHRPPQEGDRRGREDGPAAGQHVHGRRRREEPGPELGGGAARLAGHRPVRPGPRPKDHARELPDAVLVRRVARRPQHRDQPADVAPHPGAVGRDHRAQLRPEPPDPPDDRHPAVPDRVRTSRPALSGKRPDDRQGRALRARGLQPGHGLADPADPRPGRGRLGRSSTRSCIARATRATASSSTRIAGSRARTRR